MRKEDLDKKASRPQLIKLDKALKLAEQWVGNMTKSIEPETKEEQLEGRPDRLGLGAAVPRGPKVVSLNDPVARKLNSKLKVGQRKNMKSTEKSRPFVREEHSGESEEDDDENLDSRTNVFTKKRVVPVASSLQAKKKKK
ncbi:hypothetical protein NMG60_11029239 [Bertholletia excelsa]